MIKNNKKIGIIKKVILVRLLKFLKISKIILITNKINKINNNKAKRKNNANAIFFDFL